MIRFSRGHSGIFEKKRAACGNSITRCAKKIRPGQILTEPDLHKHVDGKRSTAEEQPQQNDHRYRHAEQPEQKSSSHFRLHENLDS